MQNREMKKIINNWNSYQESTLKDVISESKDPISKIKEDEKLKENFSDYVNKHESNMQILYRVWNKATTEGEELSKEEKTIYKKIILDIIKGTGLTATGIGVALASTATPLPLTTTFIIFLASWGIKPWPTFPFYSKEIKALKAREKYDLDYKEYEKDFDEYIKDEYSRLLKQKGAELDALKMDITAVPSKEIEGYELENKIDKLKDDVEEELKNGR